MHKSLLINIVVSIPSIILNIKWVYHLLKAIPFTRAGDIDKIQIKISIKYIIIALLYGIISNIMWSLIL